MARYSYSGYCPSCTQHWEREYRVCPFCGCENENYPFEGSVFDILDDMAALHRQEEESDIYAYGEEISDDNIYKIQGAEPHEICQNDIIEAQEAEQIAEKRAFSAAQQKMTKGEIAKRKQELQKRKAQRESSSLNTHKSTAASRNARSALEKNRQALEKVLKQKENRLNDRQPAMAQGRALVSPQAAAMQKSEQVDQKQVFKNDFYPAQGPTPKINPSSLPNSPQKLNDPNKIVLIVIAVMVVFPVIINILVGIVFLIIALLGTLGM